MTKIIIAILKACIILTSDIYIYIYIYIKQKYNNNNNSNKNDVRNRKKI